MEREPTFTSELVDRETLLQEQEKRAQKAVDVFDVGWIEKQIVACEEDTKTFPEHAGLNERYIAKLITDGQNFLLKQEAEFPWNATYFWRVALQSNDPYFAGVREQFTGKKATFQEFIEKIKEDLTARTVPQNSWIAGLAEYKNFLVEHNTKLQEITPSIRTYIAKNFISKINPQLDNPKSEEELAARLEEIQLQIRDPLNSSELIGSHNGAENTIGLSLQVLLSEDAEGGKGLSKEALALIAHEAIHALSSGQIVRHTSSRKYEDGMISRDTITSPQWAGLKVAGFAVSRFTWLNEAVTETLGAELVGVAPSGYPEERKLLGLLLVKGKKKLDMRTFVNAYFEKKGYQADESTGVVFWNRMREEIRESFDHDPQFLVKLDILVQNKGVGAAIALLENWDVTNPALINVKEVEKKDEE
ncbi:MAG: hypothetical protein V4467_02805 [Patescibacteria group bacterium]